MLVSHGSDCYYTSVFQALDYALLRVGWRWVCKIKSKIILSNNSFLCARNGRHRGLDCYLDFIWNSAQLGTAAYTAQILSCKLTFLLIQHPRINVHQGLNIIGKHMWDTPVSAYTPKYLVGWNTPSIFFLKPNIDLSSAYGYSSCSNLRAHGYLRKANIFPILPSCLLPQQINKMVNLFRHCCNYLTLYGDHDHLWSPLRSKSSSKLAGGCFLLDLRKDRSHELCTRTFQCDQRLLRHAAATPGHLETATSTAKENWSFCDISNRVLVGWWDWCPKMAVLIREQSMCVKRGRIVLPHTNGAKDWHQLVPRPCLPRRVSIPKCKSNSSWQNTASSNSMLASSAAVCLTWCTSSDITIKA